MPRKVAQKNLMPSLPQQPEGFLDPKVLELGRHTPSVDSVTLRLRSAASEIENITVVCRWKSGKLSVAGSAMPMEELTMHCMALQKDVMRKL